jgi:hypothetical protein
MDEIHCRRGDQCCICSLSNITCGMPSLFILTQITDVTSRLCSTCLSLILTYERGTVLDHHPSVKSLFKSAETGCPLCALLCDYYFDFQDNEKLSPRNPERHLKSISLKYTPPSAFTPTAVAHGMFTFYLHDNVTGKPPDKVEHENVLGSFTINPVIPVQGALVNQVCFCIYPQTSF